MTSAKRAAWTALALGLSGAAAGCYDLTPVPAVDSGASEDAGAEDAACDGACLATDASFADATTDGAAP